MKKGDVASLKSTETRDERQLPAILLTDIKFVSICMQSAEESRQN